MAGNAYAGLAERDYPDPEGGSPIPVRRAKTSGLTTKGLADKARRAVLRPVLSMLRDPPHGAKDLEIVRASNTGANRASVTLIITDHDYQKWAVNLGRYPYPLKRAAWSDVGAEVVRAVNALGLLIGPEDPRHPDYDPALYDEESADVDEHESASVGDTGAVTSGGAAFGAGTSGGAKGAKAPPKAPPKTPKATPPEPEPVPEPVPSPEPAPEPEPEPLSSAETETLTRSRPRPPAPPAPPAPRPPRPLDPVTARAVHNMHAEQNREVARLRALSFIQQSATRWLASEGAESITIYANGEIEITRKRTERIQL